MVYTVTLNPSIDYIVDIDNCEYGKVNRANSEKILPGGKGINVSIVLNNLGVDTMALGFAGGFTGDEIRRLLREKGVSESFVAIEGNSRINVKMRSNEETEINSVGPSISLDETREFFGKLDMIKDGDYLVLAGSIPARMSPDIYSEIVELVASKDVKIIVDTTGDALTKSLNFRPFLIKPNNFELGEYFETEITRDNVERYAVKLQRLGARNVLVSLGEDGAVLVTEDYRFIDLDAPEGQVVNTVGAGDSMVAGFVYGYELTGSLEMAAKYGIAAGSASAFSEELATEEDIIKIYKKHFEVGK